MSDTSDTPATQSSAQDGSSPETTENKSSSQIESSPVKLENEYFSQIGISPVTTENETSSHQEISPVTIENKSTSPKSSLAASSTTNKIERPSRARRQNQHLSSSLEVRKYRLCFKMIMNDYITILFMQCFKANMKYISGPRPTSQERCTTTSSSTNKSERSSSLWHGLEVRKFKFYFNIFNERLQNNIYAEV